MKHNPFFLALVALLSIVLGAGPALAISGPSGPAMGPASATANGYVTTRAQTFAGAKTFLGTVSVSDYVTTGTATFNKTAEASGETVATFKVSDDAVAKIDIVNASGTTSKFLPTIDGFGSGSDQALVIRGRTANDTGTASAVQINGQTAAGAALQNRPLLNMFNFSNLVLSFLPLNSGANLAMSWGTQTRSAPAFTTRGAGTRTIWYSAIDGSNVDYATGVESGILWDSLPQATSSFARRLYAGTTNTWQVRGDGRVEETGARVVKVRTATTSPVTVNAGTDYVIITNLAAPGAVAVNLPSLVLSGLTYVIKDGKGDAATNNITITPNSGTIDGAATKVINTNNGSVRLVHDGANWHSF